MTHVRELQNGSKQVEKYLVKKKPEMTGGIKSAMVTRDQMAAADAFTLDSAAAELFGRITAANIGNQLAVVLEVSCRRLP